MAKSVLVPVVVAAAIGVGGVGGAYAWKVRQTQGSELASLQSTLETTTKDRDLCRSELAGEKVAHEGTQKVATAASATLSASAAELEELRKQRAEADKRLAAFKSMTEKFRKMIDSGKLSVVMRSGRMVVKLPAGVLFASGSADLSSEGEHAVSDVAAILKQFPDRRFMIAGHTDNVPLGPSPYKNNWALSTARAVTVTLKLVSSGMSPTKLAAAGHGEFDPVRSNGTEAGKQENRRIEIVLLPNLSELPALGEESIAAK